MESQRISERGYNLYTHLSRRMTLRSLAGIILTVGIGGCARSASPIANIPTPTTHSRSYILYTYRNHTQRVTTVAWSLDSKYIASGSLDKTVQVWDATSGKQATIYRGHTDSINSVAWSPDSQRVVSGSSDKTVQSWDATSGKHPTIYRGHTDTVTTVAWSPDGRSIASGSADGTVRIWDAITGTQKHIYRGHTASINSVAWSPDSQRVASGSSDKTVQILNATTGDQIFTYRGHTDVVSSLSWSPDGKRIASGSWDKTVQVWNATTGVATYIYRGYNIQAAQHDSSKGILPNLIFAIAWSHNGKRIAAVTQVYCGDVCAVVFAWDADTEQNFSFYIDLPVYALAWSPDDTRFVTSLDLTNPATGAYSPSVQISRA